jgi:3-oxoacyl-[acyl-carrier protein] reductase
VDLGVEGRVALVMGASKGLGRAIGDALVRDGARVALASRDRARIEQAAAAVASETGGEVRGFAADTDDLDRLRALVTEVAGELGPVEILVTNTGGPPHGDALTFDAEDWEAAHRSLVMAPMALIEAVLPAMRDGGWGRIVNVTSIATKEPIPGLILSNSHRMAAVGAFKTLSRDLAAEGILVNSVAPGRFATDRIASLQGVSVEDIVDQPQGDVPVGRLGRVEEFADVVAFLCSDRASYVCGVNLPVDGGLLRGV